MRFYIIRAATNITQKDHLIAYLKEHKLARARDLVAIGITRATIARAVAAGDVARIGRGLYQLVGAEMEIHDALVEVSKQAPKAIICLMSALAFYELTDQMPRKVWIAIGASSWEPKIAYPPVRVVRFREPYYGSDVERQNIGGVLVPIYSIEKTLADAFRNPKLVDRSVAIEAMKSALEMRRTSPARIAAAAEKYGASKRVRPYLEALTSNG